MGKKKQRGRKSGDGNAKQSHYSGSRAYDKKAPFFMARAREFKEEGDKMFQKKDHEGAFGKYNDALKLLPTDHKDVPCLLSNMAACYVNQGPCMYHNAIYFCNMALAVAPKYPDALILRARCYEVSDGLEILELASRDVIEVLEMEPDNLMALEIGKRVHKKLENILSESPLAMSLTQVMEDNTNKRKGEKPEQKNTVDRIEEKKLDGNDAVIQLPPDCVESPPALSVTKVENDEAKKKKGKKLEQKNTVDGIEEKKFDGKFEEKKAEDKVVGEEKTSCSKEEGPKRTVKLVFGKDTIVAQFPLNWSLLQIREYINDRFRSSRAVHIKYKDKEGDLVTITTDDELRCAAELQGSLRLFVVEVNPVQDPFYERFKKEKMHTLDVEQKEAAEKGPYYIDEWIIEFAELFITHVGLHSDNYLDLRLVRSTYEAMEKTVTSEEAQGLFDKAAEKFQEMTALALFYWGNVHMSKARKMVFLTEDSSRESVIEQIRTAYDWAHQDYIKAGNGYEEALKVKPDFYEGLLALGQQQYEQAKLSWYHAIASNIDLVDTSPSTEVQKLQKKADENIYKGMEMWDDFEEWQHQMLHEDEEQATIIRSQVLLLWGTILYEHSILEYKLGIPVWHKCLVDANEKFALAGASPTDIAVMTKNHCSNINAVEGLGFRIEEILQAWNKIYKAKKCETNIPSFWLEPLLRRRVTKLYSAVERA